METELMAVVAPDTTSAPALQSSHVPDIHPVPLSRPTIPGGAATAASKRNASASSDEDEKPLAKKVRASIGGNAGKKRRIVDSDSEDEGENLPVAKKETVPAKPNGATATKNTAPASSDMSSDSDSESDAPLARKPSASKPASARPQAKPRASAASAKKRSSASSSEDEEPLAKSVNGNSDGSTGRAAAAAKKKYNVDDEESDLSSSSGSSSGSDSSEDEKPLAKKKAPTAKARASNGATASSSKAATAPAAKKAKANGTKVKNEPVSSDEDDEVPLAKKGRVSNGTAKGKGKAAAAAKDDGKVKKEDGVKVKKEKKMKEEEDEDEKYQWWLDQNADGSSKWKTLIHNGVLFPPPYIPLPKGVKMKYDGVALTLPPESEEVAGFWGAMLETDHVQDAQFQKNFFRDFKDMLKQYPPRENVRVETLEKCDFRPMFEHFEREREKKKTMTKEEKKKIKDDRDKLEEPYLFATVDGRKEKLGNFRAEPPGLFRGRGEHPRKGTLKYRLRPEDITLNIGEGVPTPIPNIPGKWKAIKHDPTVTWLAEWKENVNGNTKYVFLSAGSSWKGQSDRSKFEKARELIKHVDRIRKTYTLDLKSKVMADRQRATALYFIDKLALRAGNEKGDDEADTVGCCSLRYEHVTLEPPNMVTFDFLGKDSMRFFNTVEVEQQIFKNIKIFKAEKTKGDQLFDRLTTGGLNKYLNDFMPGLSAKVFRTYNASWTFQIQLKKLTPPNGSIAEKIAAYNDANRDVAILCNHQKTVSKNFAESFAKMGDKIRALKYQRMKLRFQLFSLEPKAKKRHPELAEEESDMDEEFMDRHEADLQEKAIEGAKKKFEKDNIKLKENKESVKPKSELDERVKEIKREFKELVKERKSRKVEAKKGATEEKLIEQIEKMDVRIAVAKTQMGDRDKTKDVALGTSKINYIDPRLTVAWAKKFDVPLEKLFSKTLREKFPWAEAEADEDWVF